MTFAMAQRLFVLCGTVIGLYRFRVLCLMTMEELIPRPAGGSEILELTI